MDHSFNIRGYTLSNSPDGVLMRMHDEYEISILPKSSGKRYIGNSIEEFQGGDLFMIGPRVPHAVQFSPANKGEVITIHFHYNSFGSGFFDLPENAGIAGLLREARLGVSFDHHKVGYFHDSMMEVYHLRAFDRMLAFLKFLNELALVKERRLLSSQGFMQINAMKEYEVVNKVYDYVIDRYEDDDISLSDISEHFNMAPNTFCRFFKKHFHKSFTRFLNEIRVGHACRMLLETNKNISEIAFASGYNQLTHFNRQFKRIIGYSPREYRKEFEQGRSFERVLL